MSVQDVIEQIVSAYLKTRMTDKQFEEMVRQALTEAEARGAQNSSTSVQDYDRGFQDGYDAGFEEGKML